MDIRRLGSGGNDANKSLYGVRSMSTLSHSQDEAAGHAPAITGAGADAAASRVLEPDAGGADTVQGKIRALISASTRFEPEDIQCNAETSVDQAMIVEVRHTLDARIKSKAITGHFPGVRSDADKQSDNPFEDAEADIPGRLRLAGKWLAAMLRQPATTYDFADEGKLYLAHATRHWQLDTCGGCLGRGKNTCSPCVGLGRVTCRNCSGSRRVPCPAWGCLYGKKSCTTCNGSGSVTKEVGYTDYVTVTAADGTSHTESQWRTRYETHPCTAYNCSYGKVTCSECSGSAYVQCTTCDLTGKVVCDACHGKGNITCAPCEGSGQTGSCAWIDVHGSPQYRLSFAGEIDPRAAEIEAKVGVHGVAAETAGLTLAQVNLDCDERPGTITANYSAAMRIAHLDAVCNQRDYHLVAYGKSLEWLDLDNIVETLLRADLELLRNALVVASGEGVFATSVDTLADPLHRVVKSEINTEIVEATLSGEALDKLHVLTSAEYVTQVHDSMLAALRQIYTREAKRLAWRILLVVVVLGVGVGLFAGRGGAAALVGLVSIPGALAVFRRRARAVLAKTLGGKQQGERALNLLVNGRRHRFAQGLIGVPLAITAALLLFLPLHGWRGTSAAASPGSVQAGQGGASAPAGWTQPASANAEVASALALRRQGQIAQARAMLRRQAVAGNAQAFGPYAASLMYDDDHHSLTNETPQLRAEALRWAQRGVQANRGDAMSLEVEGELLTSDWHHTPDMLNGLAALNQAAALGNTDAMHLLGMIYGGGRHVQQNLGESRKWFAMGANAGQAVDQYNLGLMDWYGYALPQPDRQEAMRLWKQAAAQGEERAIRAVAQGHPPT